MMNTVLSVSFSRQLYIFIRFFLLDFNSSNYRCKARGEISDHFEPLIVANKETTYHNHKRGGIKVYSTIKSKQSKQDYY